MILIITEPWILYSDNLHVAISSNESSIVLKYEKKDKISEYVALNESILETGQWYLSYTGSSRNVLYWCSSLSVMIAFSMNTDKKYRWG